MYIHTTLAINRHKKESRHGEQTLTHYMYIMLIGDQLVITVSLQYMFTHSWEMYPRG